MLIENNQILDKSQNPPRITTQVEASDNESCVKLGFDQFLFLRGV